MFFIPVAFVLSLGWFCWKAFLLGSTELGKRSALDQPVLGPRDQVNPQRKPPVVKMLIQMHEKLRFNS